MYLHASSVVMRSSRAVMLRKRYPFRYVLHKMRIEVREPAGAARRPRGVSELRLRLAPRTAAGDLRQSGARRDPEVPRPRSPARPSGTCLS